MEQAFFESCVYEAADEEYYCQNVEINGFSVDATFRSKSGRQTWHAYLTFDENGEYKYSCGMPGASGPWVLGNNIKSKLKQNI